MRRAALDDEGVHVDELFAREQAPKALQNPIGHVREICDRLFLDFTAFAIGAAQEMSHVLATNSRTALRD
jgi:hypothetical protein